MPDPIDESAAVVAWLRAEVAEWLPLNPHTDLGLSARSGAALLARLDAAEAASPRPRTRHLTPDALAAIEAVSDERPAYVDGVGFVEWSDVDRDLEMFTQAQLEERVLRAEAERDRYREALIRVGVARRRDQQRIKRQKQALASIERVNSKRNRSLEAARNAAVAERDRLRAALEEAHDLARWASVETGMIAHSSDPESWRDQMTERVGALLRHIAAALAPAE